MNYRDKQNNDKKEPQTIRMKVTHTKPLFGKMRRPTKILIINRNKIRYAVLGLVVIFTIGFAIYSFSSKGNTDKDQSLDQDKIVQTRPVDKPV
ncbi:MAG TPA: hypothetical protein VFD57_07780, partial [Clostridia bacterium]|nr:hypothetical protein [Clostridia bacterium]